MLVVLVQFVLRLAIGLAMSLLCISPRVVDGGFFRIHMWILLGLFTFAGLTTGAFPSRDQHSVGTAMPPAVATHPSDHGGNTQRDVDPGTGPLPTRTGRSATNPEVPAEGSSVDPIRRVVRHVRPAYIATGIAGLALLSYVGGVLWLYERRRPGQWLASIIAVGGLWTVLAMKGGDGGPFPQFAWHNMLDTVTSAGVLGLSVTAMLLGHWYLNSPGMQLAPLFRLIWLMLAAVAIRAIVVAWSRIAVLPGPAEIEGATVLFLGLRWVAGLAGVALTGWMARLTLLVPNTQSATGILYVSVILAFLGELTEQLLSEGSLGIQ